jgi:hypothetical protein
MRRPSRGHVSQWRERREDGHPHNTIPRNRKDRSGEGKGTYEDGGIRSEKNENKRKREMGRGEKRQNDMKGYEKIRVTALHTIHQTFHFTHLNSITSYHHEIVPFLYEAIDGGISVYPFRRV